MSGDEVMVLVISGAAGGIYWLLWAGQAIGITSLTVSRRQRWPLFVVPFLCLVPLLLVLTTLAAHEVRQSAGLIALFVAVWAISLAGVNVLAWCIGVSALADGIERNNEAALWALGGASVGTTLAVCGANVGEGPTIYTTLGPLVLAVASLGGLWVVFAVLTGNTRAITVERDTASGIRLAGLLIAWGIILGRAVAGDWKSTAATLRDFGALGWPVLIFLAIAIVLEPVVQPHMDRPTPSRTRTGWVPLLTYIGGAVLCLIR
jgi:hypothetical protein